ncbi:MAG: HD domain-containing protein [Gemmataceae bacterium]|nr:HD domain-containing protein [Gemmataceae bacterium]
MTDTKELLHKIAALRLRLDRDHTRGRDLVRPAETTPRRSDAAAMLEDKVRRGTAEQALLDGALRSFEAPEGLNVNVPVRLIPRAARLLQRARDLLHGLKALADDPILGRDENDSLVELHRAAASAIEGVLRVVQALPSGPSAQLRHCDGLETILDVVADRLEILKAGMRSRSETISRTDRLADALRRIAASQPVSVQAVEQVAEEVLNDVRQKRPLRLAAPPTDDPARAVAAHCLAVAQVFAHAIQDDAEWRGREREGVVAALVHDVGMVRLPAEIVVQARSLTDEQRRLVERHALAGAQMLLKFWPGGSWAIDVAADHHERCDGTGYPRGKSDVQLSDEVKLVTVCDVYAALAAPRPWRAALEPRTALTETLLLADRGSLDKRQAERLLHLSYYPIGSVVELDDGSIAVVVGSQTGPGALLHPARPVVTVIREAFGQAPAGPRWLDLAAQRQRSIVRSLTPQERRQLVGRLYPELV